MTRALARVFQLLGCETEAAYSGTETKEKLENTWFDYVLLDLIMPGMRGLDVYYWVTQNRPEIHCALMSAHSDEINAIKSDSVVNANNTSVFIKPIAAEALEFDFLKSYPLEVQYDLQQYAFSRGRKRKKVRGKLKGNLHDFRFQQAVRDEDSLES